MAPSRPSLQLSTRSYEPRVATFPDATLPEHAERWNAAHQTSISHWTIGRAIRRLGLSAKTR